MILQAAISGAVKLYWITKNGSYVFYLYWYNSDAQKQYKQYNAVKLAASTLIISTQVNTTPKVSSKNGALKH